MPIIAKKTVNAKDAVKEEPVKQIDPPKQQTAEQLQNKIKVGNLVIKSRQVSEEPPPKKAEPNKRGQTLEQLRSKIKVGNLVVKNQEEKQKDVKKLQKVNIDIEEPLPVPQRGRKVLKNILVNRNSDYLNHLKG